VADNEDLGQEGNEEQPLPKYDDLVTEEKEREVDLGEYEVPKTLHEAEEETQQRTDIQAILRVLTPKFASKRMNDLLQPIMVSRVFPDNYLDLNYVLNMYEMEEHEDEGDIDFVGIVTGNQAATSIGFEGRGIADRLEIAGVVHEEEMEKLTKELGLG
jgi:hypothetical protein